MGVIVNTIPKSGTHLVLKLLELLGLRFDRGVFLGPASGASVVPKVNADGRLLWDDGVVSLTGARYAAISRAGYAALAGRIAQAGDACFQAHHLWSAAGADVLARAEVRQLIVMRDPRSVALSHAEWVVDSVNAHGLRPLLTGTPLHQRLGYEFFGLPSEISAGFHPLVPLIVRYRNMEPWVNYPFLHITTFEALAGAEGADAQRREVEAIADFIGQAHFDIERVQHALWGNSPTFRHGLADRWREHWDDFPPGIDDQIAEMLAIVARMKARTPVPA